MEFKTSHEKLVQEKREIYKLQSQYRAKLEELEIKQKEIIQKIRDNCIKQHGDHIWEAFREDGPYGELFYVCENCNAENY